MISITLSQEHVTYANAKARQRYKESRSQGLKDRRQDGDSREFEFGPDFTGTLAELACKIYLREPLNLSVNDFSGADIRSDIEVRGSRLGNASLIVRPQDKDRGKLDRKFVLAILPNVHPEETTVYLMGWAYGIEVAIPKYWLNKKDREPAWWMPISDLTPISYLPTHQIEPGPEYSAWPQLCRQGKTRL